MPKCGLVCTEKASLEQYKGLCGSEKAVWFPKCGLVCTKKASLEVCVALNRRYGCPNLIFWVLRMLHNSSTWVFVSLNKLYGCPNVVEFALSRLH